MATEKEINDLIAMLDGKVEKGDGRIRVRVSQDVEEGKMVSVHHHGRCDVGSAWATGKVKNEECVDVPPLEED